MSFLLFFAYLGAKFFCLLDSLAIPPPAKSDRRTRSLYHMTNHNSFLLSLAASQFTIKVLWVSVRFLRLSSPLFHHRQILRPHESPVASLQFLTTLWRHGSRGHRPMLFTNHTCLWSSILTVASVVARSSDLKGNFASYLRGWKWMAGLEQQVFVSTCVSATTFWSHSVDLNFCFLTHL